MRSEDKIVDFKLEATEDKDGKYHFTATSLTEEFEKPPCLERLARDSVKKHVTWRHRHPINDKNNHAHIFGTITSSEVINGRIVSDYEPYTHTDLHKQFIEEIKEKKYVGDPIGVSMRYRKYYDDDGKIIHLDVFEHAVTPYPRCDDCLHIDEYIGENENMLEKPKEEIKKDPQGDVVDVVDDKTLEEHMKKIEELEKSLNSKTEVLEGYKTQIETLEKEIKNTQDSKKQAEMSLEDRVKSLEEKLEVQKKDYENKIDYLKKKPVLEVLFEASPKPLDDKEKKFYETYSLEDLNKKVKEWDSAKPVVKSMGSTAKDIQNEQEKLEKEGEKNKGGLTEDQINEFVKDERIRRIMKNVIKKDEDNK